MIQASHAIVESCVSALRLLIHSDPCRLEEITDQTAKETLQQFDSRLDAAAQSLMRDEWLEDLVAAGGSPADVLRLSSTQPTKQVGACSLLRCF